MMNPTETKAVLSLKQEFIQSVEPVTLVSSLYRSGFVMQSFYKSVQLLSRNGDRREEVSSYVIESLPFQVGFSALVITLDKCGYHKLAARLFLKLFEFNHVYRIHNSGTVGRTKLQSFFRNLKRMVHDSQFKNPRKALRNLAIRCKTELDDEIGENKRQLLADRCVAIIGVEIDAFYDSLACENEITQEEMFIEMRKLIPNTSNPLITDTVYYTRQANMHAFHGNIQHAQNMMIQARTSASSLEHCTELVNMLYVEVYVKLWEFEINPSKSVLDSIMMWGRIGLESLETEDEATKQLWRRMFILRMVFALLGIGNRANIIPQYSVDAVSLQEAQTLLAVLDTNWDGIEVRREMFYCVARARLNEQLCRYEEAKHYIQRAKYLALQGRFLEKVPFIDEFATVIEQNIDRSSLASSSRSIGDINSTSGSSAFLMDQTQVKYIVGCTGLRRPITSNKDISSNVCENQDDLTELKSSRSVQRCKDMKFGECRSASYSGSVELNRFHNEDTDQLGEIDLQQTTKFSYTNTGQDYQTSDRNDNIRIQNLKCCDNVASFSMCSRTYPVCDKNCDKVDPSQDHCAKDHAVESRETSVKSLVFGVVEELKLSGGDLALYSGNASIKDFSPNLSTFTNYSNTEAKVFERSSDSFSCLQSDRCDNRKQAQRNITKSHLLHQCKEGVDFGSVALFEDRSEGDGASHIPPQIIITDNTQAPNLKSGYSANTAQDIINLDENRSGSDFDDVALFGDGT